MSNLEPGDTYRSADGEQYWQINKIQRTYQLHLRPVNGSDDPETAETATYPEDVLQRKIDRGDLKPVTFESDDTITHDLELPDDEEVKDAVDKAHEETHSEEDTEEGEPAEEDKKEATDGGTVTKCSVCNRTFSSEQGLSIHQGMMDH